MSIQRIPLKLCGGLALAGLGTPNFWPVTVDALQVGRAASSGPTPGVPDTCVELRQREGYGEVAFHENIIKIPVEHIISQKIDLTKAIGDGGRIANMICDVLLSRGLGEKEIKLDAFLDYLKTAFHVENRAVDTIKETAEGLYGPGCRASSVRGMLEKGKRLYIVGCDGDWLKVRTDIDMNFRTLKIANVDSSGRRIFCQGKLDAGSTIWIKQWNAVRVVADEDSGCASCEEGFGGVCAESGTADQDRLIEEQNEIILRLQSEIGRLRGCTPEVRNASTQTDCGLVEAFRIDTPPGEVAACDSGEQAQEGGHPAVEEVPEGGDLIDIVLMGPIVVHLHGKNRFQIRKNDTLGHLCNVKIKGCFRTAGLDEFTNWSIRSNKSNSNEFCPDSAKGSAELEQEFSAFFGLTSKDLEKKVNIIVKLSKEDSQNFSQSATRCTPIELISPRVDKDKPEPMEARSVSISDALFRTFATPDDGTGTGTLVVASPFEKSTQEHFIKAALFCLYITGRDNDIKAGYRNDKKDTDSTAHQFLANYWPRYREMFATPEFDEYLRQKDPKNLKPRMLIKALELESRHRAAALQRPITKPDFPALAVQKTSPDEVSIVCSSVGYGKRRSEYLARLKYQEHDGAHHFTVVEDSFDTSQACKANFGNWLVNYHWGPKAEDS